MSTKDIQTPSFLLSFLHKNLPETLPTSSPDDPAPTASTVLRSAFPSQTYTGDEETTIASFLTSSSHLEASEEDGAKRSERLSALNNHLSGRTTILGSKPSIADLAVYAKLAPTVKNWTPEQKTGENGYHHIVRHIAYVQGAPVFGLVSNLQAEDKAPINEDEVVAPIKPIDPKAEKERKKREKEAAEAAGKSAASNGAKLSPTTKDKSSGDAIAAATGSAVPLATSGKEAAAATDSKTEPAKKEKKAKEKKPKQPEPPKDTTITPALIDLRVGHILRAKKHPDADSLYVSTIDCGDAVGADNTSVDEQTGKTVRTVCSGLNGLVPLDAMQDRRVVVVCNLKPVKMRGIQSAAMVLAASPRLKEGEEDNHAGPVELVAPPDGATPGMRCVFEGWEAGEPEKQLAPKKKVWENCQVGFTTTDGKEVAFDAAVVDKTAFGDGAAQKGLGKLRAGEAGLCTVPSLTGATVR